MKMLSIDGSDKTEELSKIAVDNLCARLGVKGMSKVFPVCYYAKITKAKVFGQLAIFGVVLEGYTYRPTDFVKFNGRGQRLLWIHTPTCDYPSKSISLMRKDFTRSEAITQLLAERIKLHMSDVDWQNSYQALMLDEAYKWVDLPIEDSLGLL